MEKLLHTHLSIFLETAAVLKASEARIPHVLAFGLWIVAHVAQKRCTCLPP